MAYHCVQCGVLCGPKPCCPRNEAVVPDLQYRLWGSARVMPQPWDGPKSGTQPGLGDLASGQLRGELHAPGEEGCRQGHRLTTTPGREDPGSRAWAPRRLPRQGSREQIPGFPRFPRAPREQGPSLRSAQGCACVGTCSSRASAHTATLGHTPACTLSPQLFSGSGPCAAAQLSQLVPLPPHLPTCPLPPDSVVRAQNGAYACVQT